MNRFHVKLAILASILVLIFGCKKNSKKLHFMKNGHAKQAKHPFWNMLPKDLLLYPGKKLSKRAWLSTIKKGCWRGKLLDIYDHQVGHSFAMLNANYGFSVSTKFYARDSQMDDTAKIKVGQSPKFVRGSRKALYINQYVSCSRSYSPGYCIVAYWLHKIKCPKGKKNHLELNDKYDQKIFIKVRKLKPPSKKAIATIKKAKLQEGMVSEHIYFTKKKPASKQAAFNLIKKHLPLDMKCRVDTEIQQRKLDKRLPKWAVAYFIRNISLMSGRSYEVAWLEKAKKHTVMKYYGIGCDMMPPKKK